MVLHLALPRKHANAIRLGHSLYTASHPRPLRVALIGEGIEDTSEINILQSVPQVKSKLFMAIMLILLPTQLIEMFTLGA
jgi:hypothetical protein